MNKHRYTYTYSHRYYFFKISRPLHFYTTVFLIRLNFISANTKIHVSPIRYFPPPPTNRAGSSSPKKKAAEKVSQKAEAVERHKRESHIHHPWPEGWRTQRSWTPSLELTGIAPWELMGLEEGNLLFGFRPIFRGPWTCGCFEECI